MAENKNTKTQNSYKRRSLPLSWVNDSIRKTGLKVTTAYCNKFFAIHRPICGEVPGAYAVTHLMTGKVCFFAPSLAKAKIISDYLSANFGEAFGKISKFSTTETVKGICARLVNDKRLIILLRENSFDFNWLVEIGAISSKSFVQW